MHERTGSRTRSQIEQRQVGQDNIRMDTQRRKTSKRETQKEIERQYWEIWYQSVDESGSKTKCMARVVEAICQHWHERLRWWWRRGIENIFKMRILQMVTKVNTRLQFCPRLIDDWSTARVTKIMCMHRCEVHATKTYTATLWMESALEFSSNGFWRLPQHHVSNRRYKDKMAPSGESSKLRSLFQPFLTCPLLFSKTPYMLHSLYYQRISVLYYAHFSSIFQSKPSRLPYPSYIYWLYLLASSCLRPTILDLPHLLLAFAAAIPPKTSWSQCKNQCILIEGCYVSNFRFPF